jgi:hypothetical protein
MFAVVAAVAVVGAGRALPLQLDRKMFAHYIGNRFAVDRISPCRDRGRLAVFVKRLFPVSLRNVPVPRKVQPTSVRLRSLSRADMLQHELLEAVRAAVEGALEEGSCLGRHAVQLGLVERNVGLSIAS